jgi:hypothetical protein
VHNVRLAGSRPLRQFVADKLDALVHNRQPPSAGLLQQLLHHDQPPAPAGVAAADAAAAAAGGRRTASSRAGMAAEGGSSSNGDPTIHFAPPAAAQAAAPAELLGFGVRVSVSCPKLGVALCMESPAAAPATGPATMRPAFVQVTMHALSLDVSTSGGLAGWLAGWQGGALFLRGLCWLHSALRCAASSSSGPMTCDPYEPQMCCLVHLLVQVQTLACYAQLTLALSLSPRAVVLLICLPVCCRSAGGVCEPAGVRAVRHAPVPSAHTLQDRERAQLGVPSRVQGGRFLPVCCARHGGRRYCFCCIAGVLH